MQAIYRIVSGGKLLRKKHSGSGYSWSADVDKAMLFRSAEDAAALIDDARYTHSFSPGDTHAEAWNAARVQPCVVVPDVAPVKT